jgi:NAD(P)-dependent dehydrogenase (short-subunit alcohol dehydrogenase family)
VAPPRTVLVTGATSGIGLVTAQRLHADGYAVVLHGRDEGRGAAALRELGSRAHFIALDLTAENAAQQVVDFALSRTGRLDVCVNNAGRDHTGALLDVPAEEIRATLETNTLAAILVLQASARVMKEHGGGSIINVTSRLASIGVPTMGVYGASKGALRTLTRAAAVELAPYDIRVNAVAPGLTRTPLYERWLDRQADPVQAEAESTRDIPLGRLASSEDVAHAIAFLASPQASYLTGITVPVDGGYTAR